MLGVFRLWRRVTGMAVLGLLVFVAVAPQTVAEEAGSRGTPVPPMNANTLFRPMKDVLSGPLWLIANEIGPNALSREVPREAERAGEVRLQAAGAAGALVPFRSPAPGFSRNILITRDLGRLPFQTEPHIAVNPKNPEHLVIGEIDYNFVGAVTYHSLDGGQTWDGPFPVKYLGQDLISAGDPTVAFGRDGTAYFTHISLGSEEFRVGPAVGDALVSTPVLSKSKDGGRSWSEPVLTARSTVRTDLRPGPRGVLQGTISFSFIDKPWMTVGPHPTIAGRDMVYITYTEFADVWEIFYIGELPFLGNPVLTTTIKMVRSEDGGETWKPPVSVSPTVRRLFGPDSAARRIVQGSQATVGKDGALYVAWLDSTDDDSQKGVAEIYVARSTDAGATFSTPVRATTFLEPFFRPRASPFRYWATAFPQLAIGLQGQVYMVYGALPAGKPADDGDILFIRSVDQGRTWSRPTRLNDDEGSSLQFFPAIAVDPKGVIHVTWGDMRDDPADARYHIYYTRSEDRGVTWGFELPQLPQRVGSTRITDFSSNPNFGFPSGRFIGDYFALAASETDVYAVWADTRLGEFGSLNQKIGFARRKAIQVPSIFVSPPSGPGGKDVVIQGFNFQPDSQVLLEVGGVLLGATRTNQEGRFTTRLFMPISSEGAHSIAVFDQSGNVAIASFFVEFGFDTVKGGQKTLADQIGQLGRQLRNLSTGPQVSPAALAELQRQVDGLRALLVQPPKQEASPSSENPLTLATTAGLAAVVASVLTIVVSRRFNRR